jgi:hypothetical protein
MSPEAYKKGCMSVIFDRLLPLGFGLHEGTVRDSTLCDEKLFLICSFVVPNHIYPL